MSKKVKKFLSVIGVIVGVGLLLTSSVFTENAVISHKSAMLFTIGSVVVLLIAICFAVKMDYETGIYECRKCGHVFVPEFMAYIWGSHTLTTRHLRCPVCGEKSWCKRKPNN